MRRYAAKTASDRPARFIAFMALAATLAALAACDVPTDDAPDARGPQASDGTVTECDRLAAYGQDYDRKAPPVGDSKVYIVDKAEDACREALREHPDQPRILFQLSRALFLRQLPKPTEEVHRYLRKAANLGYPAAQYFLYRLYESEYLDSGDSSEPMRLLREAASAGHQDAQVGLAGKLDSFENKSNIEEAIDWYRLSADQGNSYANFTLAIIFHQGRYGSQDIKKALFYYRRAAENGIGYDKRALAEILLEGKDGIPKDIEEGILWLDRAAGQGDQWAQIQLGNYYHAGKFVPKNEQKTREYYCMIEARERAKFLYHKLINSELSCPLGSNTEDEKPWWEEDKEIATAIAAMRSELRRNRAKASAFGFEDYFISSPEDGAISRLLGADGYPKAKLEDYVISKDEIESVYLNEDGARSATAGLQKFFPPGSRISRLTHHILEIGGTCGDDVFAKANVDENVLECEKFQKGLLNPFCLTLWKTFIYQVDNKEDILRTRVNALPCAIHRHMSYP